jgi:hypothetical protein
MFVLIRLDRGGSVPRQGSKPEIVIRARLRIGSGNSGIADGHARALLPKALAMTIIDDNLRPARQSDTLADDLLEGAQAIATFLGIEVRKVFHGVERGHIPVTRRGRIIIGSKRRLTRHYTGE